MMFIPAPTAAAATFAASGFFFFVINYVINIVAIKAPQTTTVYCRLLLNAFGNRLGDEREFPRSSIPTGCKLFIIAKN